MCCNCNQPAKVYFDQISEDVEFSGEFTVKSALSVSAHDILILAHYMQQKANDMELATAVFRVVDHLDDNNDRTLADTVRWIKNYW